MNCMYCGSRCIKAGVRKTGVQKFQCGHCKKFQQNTYRKKAYCSGTDQDITKLLVEGLGIRGIARILKIAISTVIQRIKKIAKSIEKPISLYKNGTYEIDELWTFTTRKSNETWIMYVFDRVTKAVIDFKVGARTKVNLQSLTDQALLLSPQKICTDGLNIYRSLIPENIHWVGLSNTRPPHLAQVLACVLACLRLISLNNLLLALILGTQRNSLANNWPHIENRAI